MWCVFVWMGSSIQQQYLVPGLWVRETHWSTSFSNSWRNPIVIIFSSSFESDYSFRLLLYCLYFKLQTFKPNVPKPPLLHPPQIAPAPPSCFSPLLLWTLSLYFSASLSLSFLARTRVDRSNSSSKQTDSQTRDGAGPPGRSPPPQHQQQSAARAPATKLRSNNSQIPAECNNAITTDQQKGTRNQRYAAENPNRPANAEWYGWWWWWRGRWWWWLWMWLCAHQTRFKGWQ